MTHKTHRLLETFLISGNEEERTHALAQYYAAYPTAYITKFLMNDTDLLIQVWKPIL